MYQQFFNFNAAPFSIAPDPHFIYMSGHHQEGLAHLLYGIKQGGGFVALTGEVGTGKTTLCHCLLERLPDTIDIALVLNPKLNAVELLATVCDELQITYDQDKQTLKSLVDSLNRHLLEAHALGRKTVLMIDEAQNLSLDVLEQIRLLTNLETSKTKLLQIILIGQPELKQLLEKTELRQLNQRITARYHLSPLSYSDTQKYIQHRLTVCGGDEKIFTHNAIKKVYKLTGGIPRLINILSDRGLLGAYTTNNPNVTKKIIKKAAKEVFSSSHGSGYTYLLNTILALILLIAGLAITMHLLSPTELSKNHIISSESFKKPIVEPNVELDVEPDVEERPQQILADAKITKPKVSPLDFISAIKQQKISFNSAMSKLAILWDRESQDTDCMEIKKTGVHCLLDKAAWKDLIALNRPVVLEFPLQDSEKSYVLLLGLEQGNPIFWFNEKLVFPVEQVVDLWDGFYLMLWQSPVQNITEVYPEQSSEAVTWIRKQIDSIQPDSLRTLNSYFFDKQLKNEVIKFQQQHFLTPDGIVGPRTFIHLQNYDPQYKPKLEMNN
ncbi:MAG: AAA family ATPase [Methylococcales bacterium]|nr:AAA family ATPase [Methylococcales bacterium]